MVDRILDKGRGALADEMARGAARGRAPSRRAQARLRSMIEGTRYETLVAALDGMKERKDRTVLLPTIAVPAMVDRRRRGSPSSPRKQREMAAAIPGARTTIVPGAGHLTADRATRPGQPGTHRALRGPQGGVVAVAGRGRPLGYLDPAPVTASLDDGSPLPNTIAGPLGYCAAGSGTESLFRLCPRGRSPVHRIIPASRRSSLAVALVAFAAAACSGGGSGDAEVSEVTASLRVLGGTVEVQPPSADFTGGVDGQPLNAGFTIRTGADGRAAIEYFDGSITRLDENTTFTIVTLQILDNEDQSRSSRASSRRAAPTAG